MKSVIVSYGHIDPVLPLFKHLNAKVDCDLILVFSQRQKYESILSFEDIAVNDGFLDKDTTGLVLSRIGLFDCYPKIRIFVYHNNRIRSLRNLFLVRSFASHLKAYDTVHFNGQHTTLIPLLYLLPWGKKLLFTIHDYKPHSGEEGKFKIFGCYWNNRFIIKRNWWVVLQNQADYCLAKSENTEASDNIYFIPFGIFENYLYWSDKQDIDAEYDVLFFGRISDYKGLKYLLQAILQIQTTSKDISICIAGSGDLSVYLPLIEQVGNCKMINKYISSSDLVGLIMGSKMVVCPYTDATQSGVIMTAFAFNKPVIASAVGGFPEIIVDGKTGFLVKPKDVNDLSDKIRLLHKNEELISEISANIEKFKNLSDFNWESIASQYLKLYEEIKALENSNNH